MGDNKVLEMFDSIPQFDTFSKYSSSLQRIFKHSSFKNLLQELKSPKKFNEYEKENKKNEHGKFFTDNISNLEDQMLMKIKNDENEDFFDEKYDGKNIKKVKSPKVNKQETFFQKKNQIYLKDQIHINIIQIIMQFIGIFLQLNLLNH